MPIAAGGRALDGLGIAEFDAGAQLLQVRRQQLIDHLAGARSALAQQPGGPTQRLQRDRPARLGHDRILRGRHYQQFVLEPRPHHQLAFVAWAFDQSKIELEGRHLACYGLGVGDGDLQIQGQTRSRRQRAAECSHDRRQQVIADRGAGTNAQAADLRLPVQRPAFDRARAVEQRARLRQQRSAVVVELQTLADTLEQRQAERVLELQQRGAGGRLRQRDGIRGSGGRTAVGNAAEHLQLPQTEAQSGHGRSPSTYFIG